MFHLRRAVVVAVLALLSATCGDDGTTSPVSPSSISALTIESVLSGVGITDTRANLQRGSAPAPGSGPTVTVSGNETVVNGGTLNASLSASAPFQTLYVYVGSKTVGLNSEATGGLDGFYELHLPAATTQASVLLAFPQEIPLHEMQLLFGVADPSGVVGPYSALSATVLSVGTGDIQVTLSWDVNSDLDVHVLDPSGEEVFFAHPRAASGGELDLDSNAACLIDGIRNENITWPIGRAPQGQYTVRVDYWDSCGVPQTNYVVRINSGSSVQVFTGNFTGIGDAGGPGSGRTITTFQRLTGPAPTPVQSPAADGARPASKSRSVETSSGR